MTARAVRAAKARLPRPLRLAIDWAISIGVAVALVLTFEAEVAKPYRIPSASMEPTLHCARPAPGCRAEFSDRVLADRLAYRRRQPRRQEIVVFHAPRAASAVCGAGGVFVKRIIGLPGDLVELRRGAVFVNGRRLDEPYIHGARQRGDASGTWTVPAGKYFLLGDNRTDSCDSRVFGMVPRHALIGPVVARYWPPTRLGETG